MGSDVSCDLYRKVEIWKRGSSNEMVRFTCFERLADGKYCVQSADYFYLPVDNEQITNLNKQQIELFIEVEPSERSKFFKTVSEAVAAHELEFG